MASRNNHSQVARAPTSPVKIKITNIFLVFGFGGGSGPRQTHRFLQKERFFLMLLAKSLRVSASGSEEIFKVRRFDASYRLAEEVSVFVNPAVCLPTYPTRWLERGYDRFVQTGRTTCVFFVTTHEPEK